jgi:hypothetical protein
MRFMLLLKADRRTEAGVLPTTRELATMGRYNEQLVKAGVLLDAAGLQPSSKGATVRFRDGKAEVVEGPLGEAKDRIAGYWVIRVRSREEAIEWAKRMPFDHVPGEGRASEVELRRMFETNDFVDVPPEVAREP